MAASTYPQAITQDAQETRYLLKIQGFEKYLASFDGGTYDDGGADSALPVVGNIVNVSPSGGSLDLQNHIVTASTLSVKLLDSEWLRGKFASRTAVQHLEAAMTVGGGTVNLGGGNTASYTAGDHVFVDREAMYIDSKTSSTLTVTRARLDTTAVAHPLGTTASLYPRYWRGRTAKLFKGSKHQDGSWQYTEYRTYTAEGSPTFENGVWSLSFNSDAAEYDRPIYTGFHDVDITQIEWAGGETPQVRVTVSDISQFDDSNPMNTLMLESDLGRGFFPIVENSISNNTFEIQHESLTPYGDLKTVLTLLLGGDRRMSAFFRNGARSTKSFTEMKGRMVFHLSPEAVNGNVAWYGLVAMTSNRGDAAGSQFDVLYGLAATDERFEIRAGAGLTSSQVDEQAWGIAGQKSQRGTQFFLGVDGETTLFEFLQKEIMPVLGGYLYKTNDNKLSVKLYEPITTATTKIGTLSDSNILSSDNIINDEATVISSIAVSTDYDWTNDKFRRIDEVNYKDIQARYLNDTGKIEVMSRAVLFSRNDSFAAFDTYIARFGEGALTISAVVPWFANLWAPGDVVSITNSRLPNFQTPTGTISGENFEIIATTPDDEQGTVALTLVKVPTARMIAPTIKLGTNISGNQWNASAQYSDHDMDEEWAVGWGVRAVSTVGVVSGSATTISAVTSTTITFASDIGWVQNGYVVIENASGASSYTQINDAVSGTLTDYAYIGDNNENPSNSKWG